MSQRRRRTIYPLSSKDGRLIYKIPVDDTDDPNYAYVEGNIWDELLTKGLNPRLIDKDGHVCFRVRYTYYPLGYLIMDCTNEDNIAYKDNNRFNLRQENIRVHTNPKQVEKYKDWLKLGKRLMSLYSVDYARVQHNGI